MVWQHQSVTSRGTRHGSPDKAKDVDLEMRIAVEENWFQQINGRRLRVPEDRAKDVVTQGVTNLYQNGAFKRWWDGRVFKRSREEKWTDNVPQV